MVPEDGVNEEELEAEFLALMGGQPQALEKLKGKGEAFTAHIHTSFQGAPEKGVPIPLEPPLLDRTESIVKVCVQLQSFLMLLG